MSVCLLSHMGAFNGRFFAIPGPIPSFLTFPPPTQLSGLPFGKLKRCPPRLIFGGDVVERLALDSGIFPDLARAGQPDQVGEENADLEDAARIMVRQAVVCLELDSNSPRYVRSSAQGVKGVLRNFKFVV